MTTALFVCRGCGDSWPNDPRLIAPCPTCGANANVHCRRPSGHSGPAIEPHKARRLASFKLLPCSCLAAWDAQHATRQDDRDALRDAVVLDDQRAQQHACPRCGDIAPLVNRICAECDRELSDAANGVAP